MRARHLAPLALLLAPCAPRAAEPDAPKAITVEVGKTVELCGTVALCPVSSVVCDDPSLARAEATAVGVGLRGLKPGTTLCAAVGSNLARRQFEVTVTPPRPPRR